MIFTFEYLFCFLYFSEILFRDFLLKFWNTDIFHFRYIDNYVLYADLVVSLPFFEKDQTVLSFDSALGIF